MTSAQLANVQLMTTAWLIGHGKLSQPPHVIVNPHVLTSPTVQQLMSAYPSQAQIAHVEGHVRLACVVMKTAYCLTVPWRVKPQLTRVSVSLR
jgi:hypothetical protein